MKTAADGTTAASSALPTVDPSEDAEVHDTDSADTDSPDTDVSWVDRCQRQFGDGERRLGNLADDENCAFYDGV